MYFKKMERIKILFVIILFPVVGFCQQFLVLDTSNSAIPSNIIKTLNTDSAGNIWFVTGDCFSGGNLVCYNNKTFIEYDTTNGIPDNFITCIAFDNNGRLWAGSRYHGISSFNGKTWINYNPLNSALPDIHARCITIDKLNRLWIGTDNGLAVFYNNKWEVFNKANSALPDNTVNSIACDNKSNAIWIATDKGILYAYNYSAIKEMINPAPIVYTKKNSALPDDLTTQVLLDDSSNVWISSWGGIVKIENDKWKVITPNDSKLPSFVEYIITPHLNQLWIATNMGLYILKNDQWQIYTPSNSNIPNFFINKVIFDKTGNAWIATQSGLVKCSR